MLYASEDRSRDFWDANIWIAYALKGHDPHYNSCRFLFDDLRDGKRVVYVSSLVVGEVVQVIRRGGARIAAQGRGGKTPIPQAAQALADMLASVFFYELGRLNDEGSVAIKEPTIGAMRYPNMSLGMMVKHRGRFALHGKMGLIYRGLGMVDMMNAYAARDSGAKNFWTLDKQFAELVGEPEFDALRFFIL